MSKGCIEIHALPALAFMETQLEGGRGLGGLQPRDYISTIRSVCQAYMLWLFLIFCLKITRVGSGHSMTGAYDLSLPLLF